MPNLGGRDIDPELMTHAVGELLDPAIEQFRKLSKTYDEGVARAGDPYGTGKIPSDGPLAATCENLFTTLGTELKAVADGHRDMVTQWEGYAEALRAVARGASLDDQFAEGLMADRQRDLDDAGE